MCHKNGKEKEKGENKREKRKGKEMPRPHSDFGKLGHMLLYVASTTHYTSTFLTQQTQRRPIRTQKQTPLL